MLAAAGTELAAVDLAFPPNTLLLELRDGWHAWPPPSGLLGAASSISGAAVEAARASSLVIATVPHCHIACCCLFETLALLHGLNPLPASNEEACRLQTLVHLCIGATLRARAWRYACRI